MSSNTDPGEADFEAQMQALRAQFASGLPARRTALAAAWASCQAGTSERDWQALRDVAHRLAGSAASFGLDTLGEAARELDRLLSRPPVCRDPTLAAPRVAILTAALERSIASV